MTHILRPIEAHRGRPIGRPYACVEVKVKSLRPRVLEVAPGKVAVFKADAQVVALPDDVVVVDERGKRIKATGTFLITTETFDPWHALTDYLGEWR